MLAGGSDTISRLGLPVAVTELEMLGEKLHWRHLHGSYKISFDFLILYLQQATDHLSMSFSTISLIFD